MRILEWLLDQLAALGVPVTRLRWRLYNLERASGRLKDGPRLPTAMRWMGYKHKLCFHCGALNDRTERQCVKCGKRLRSIWAYRLFRALGLVIPEGSPPVSAALLSFMLVIFCAGVLRDGWAGLAVPSLRTMEIFGVWRADWVFGRGEWWRFLSCGLVHFGVIHIGFNAFALLQIGPVIESQIGPKRFVGLLTLTQLAAFAVSAWWYGGALNPTAGASGWLMGLVGFGIGHFHDQVGPAKQYQGMLIRWAVYVGLFGLIVNANNAAHAGGLLAGLLLSRIPGRHPRLGGTVNAAWTTLFALSLCLWAAGLVFMTKSIVMGWSAPAP